MKRSLRWLCPVLFIAAAIAVIWFLHLFTQINSSMSMIDWDSAAQIMPDGTEQPFSTDTYSNTTDLSGTYRFTGTLPEGLGNGTLLFETTGASLTLSINGEVVWRSEAVNSDGTINMAQGTFPVSEETSGKLELTCQILDGTQVMFPPLIRFVPENLDIMESTALANRAAFPAGAATLALVLVFGVFLLSILAQKTDFSLIPLMFAISGLILLQLIRTEGYYFLPQSLTEILGRQEMGFVVVILLFLYLILNRNRHFWKYFGIACAWSAGAFLACLLFSKIHDGYLASYVFTGLIPQLQSGFYDGLLYWLSLWLSFAAALISAFGVLRAFARQQAAAQALEVKNCLVTDSYHALQERIEEDAAARHELHHRLTALDCLCREQDLAGIREVLDQMLREQSQRTGITFTKNPTVNAILQDAAARGARLSVRFDTEIRIPETLNIPETDLCSLLMNILDNALEAAEKVFPEEKRFVTFHLNLNDSCLALLCRNSFTGELKKDKHGNLITTKEDALAHGFGFRQIREISGKYQGILRFHTEEDSIFVLQLALNLPDKK